MPSADCDSDHRLVRCKVAFTFKSPPKTKGPQTKKLYLHKLLDPRVKNNLQVMLEGRLHCVTAAESGEQWKQMKTILQGNHGCNCRPVDQEPPNTDLMKQMSKSKSCSKRNACATIVCLQNLMVKLPRLHIRLPAVYSRPSFGPCRMIGGQDLLRGQNGMPTWMTCAPSMRH